MNEDILTLFRTMVKEQASDLILRTGHRPAARVEGHIRYLSESVFGEEDARQLLDQILEPNELEEFRRQHEKDTAFVVPGVGRFRANLCQQRRREAFCFRHVKEAIPPMAELHLPEAPLHRLCLMHRGLVLVTGVAGSGKSTTLASMIDFMNERTQRHVVTIEDPIEYVFQDGSSVITQREVGIDTSDYRTALKAVVRQAPDVILIGEMRDAETVSAALMAAETGHLVLATLHTVNAVQTVERILSFYPPHRQDGIRLQLALVLEGVISQRLITRRAQPGRVPAVEILLGTPTVKDMVLEGRTRELPDALEDGHNYYGSQTFNQSLVKLVRDGLIDFEDGLEAADSPDELKLALRGITKGTDHHRATHGDSSTMAPGIQTTAPISGTTPYGA